VDAFCRAGHHVCATTRDKKNRKAIERFGARAVEWSLADCRSLASEIRQTDVLVHAAFEMGPEGAGRDREAVGFFLEELARTSGLRRFLYTSGVWVLGNLRDNVVPDNAVPERSPDIVSWRPPIERQVLGSAAKGITPLVIRPGIVYGGAGGLTGFLMGAATREHGIPVIGSGHNRWSPVHRDDLANLYVRAAEQAPAASVLNGTDGSCPTVAMIAGALSEALGFEGRTQSLSPEEAKKAWGDLADGLALDQCVPGDWAGKLLGWRPRHRSIVSEAEALVRSWKAAQAD
jgi:nucleoside-diphosphate-sugar epimerase